MIKYDKLMTKEEIEDLFGPCDWGNIPDDAKILCDDGVLRYIPDLVQ